MVQQLQATQSKVQQSGRQKEECFNGILSALKIYKLLA
jgi:hypothetical protein